MFFWEHKEEMTRWYYLFCCWCWKRKYLQIQRLHVTEYTVFFYAKLLQSPDRGKTKKPQKWRASRVGVGGSERVNWLVREHFSAAMKNKQIELYLLGNGLLLGSVSDHHVHRPPAEPLRDAFEAALLAWRERGQRLKSKGRPPPFPTPGFLKLLHSSLPVLVALYMFSIGNADPSPYSRTLERAGMSWVVVTSTFTQFGLNRTPRIYYYCGATGK